jgi:hypothetical protein
MFLVGQKVFAIAACTILLASVLMVPTLPETANATHRQISHQPAFLLNAAPVRDQPDSLIATVRPSSETSVILARLCPAQPAIYPSMVETYRLGLRSPPA